MWTYEQSTGLLRDKNSQIVGAGYSGHNIGRMQTSQEAVKNVGPIPRGFWEIGQAMTHATLGPVAMSLTPAPATETFGRSGFFIHGDSNVHPGLASDGCIVLAFLYRQIIARSDDKLLEVVG